LSTAFVNSKFFMLFISNMKPVLFFLLALPAFLPAQDAVKAREEIEIKKFQQELNAEYKDPKKSPLEPRDRKKFKQHVFFEVDLKFRVSAKLKMEVDAKPFKMKTSTNRMAE
jgi:uncharacterized protein